MPTTPFTGIKNYMVPYQSMVGNASSWHLITTIQEYTIILINILSTKNVVEIFFIPFVLLIYLIKLHLPGDEKKNNSVSNQSLQQGQQAFQHHRENLLVPKSNGSHCQLWWCCHLHGNMATNLPNILQFAKSQTSKLDGILSELFPHKSLMSNI